MLLINILGLVDTAVKTAETGYMARRLMKVIRNYDDDCSIITYMNLLGAGRSVYAI